MASKGEKQRKEPTAEKRGGLLGGIPFGSALDVLDGVGSFLFKFFLQRYQVETKIERFKDDATKRVEEIKGGAVRTAYAVKKAFFRAVVEAVFLTTGLLAFILGCILIVSDLVPLKYVLVVYGAVTIAVIAIILKTQK